MNQSIHPPAATEPRVLVLLCTYNERQNLPEVLAGVWQTLPNADVLVMDDNSPDGTGEWAREAQGSQPKLHVVVRAGKLGLGSALREGIQWCCAREYDFLINLDADQSHDPRAAERLLQACLDAAAEPAAAKTAVAKPPVGSPVVAIGSRYVAGGSSVGLSPWRRMISRALNGYASLLLRLPIADCSGSYRCYPVPLLRQLQLAQLTCDGYGFLEEVLVHLARLGAGFREVAITYHVRGSGRSKLALGDALGALAVIHRLALSKGALSKGTRPRAKHHS